MTYFNIISYITSLESKSFKATYYSIGSVPQVIIDPGA